MTEAVSSTQGFPILQGWWAPTSFDVSAAFLRAEGWAILRTEAFPDISGLKARLQSLKANLRGHGRICLDLRGLRDSVDQVISLARESGVAFLIQTADLDVKFTHRCDVPQIFAVRSADEAAHAQSAGAAALLAKAQDVAGLQPFGLPVLATVSDATEMQTAIESGAAGLQPRSPGLLQESHLHSFVSRLMNGMSEEEQSDFHSGPAPLPSLRIRHLELPYPIIQGAMGVGVSWEKLAGAVASEGCVGLISAIGTGYHRSANVTLHEGRPMGIGAFNPPEAIEDILRLAQKHSGGHGAIGVNILSAINGYEPAVRASIKAGAQIIVSGAGLPLALPGIAGDAEVALVPIVSSARALALICRQWSRKYSRLPDAIVVEGPKSGGHQGFTAEQCEDPNYELELLLPDILKERDKWGDMPVIVAGGIWDRADIDKFIAMGASGVQIATRFIGTFECDAHQSFKDALLRADKEDIVIMKSPVGMPARGIQTHLQTQIAEGRAPRLKCLSQCLQSCSYVNGGGAREAGYCIADRLADAMLGKSETGLFFSGSNGYRLKEMLSVRDLLEELTQDPGLSRRAGLVSS